MQLDVSGDGAKFYTTLPRLRLNVNKDKASVDTTGAVSCSKGGDSVPIIVSVVNAPIDAIEVSIIKTTYNASVTDAVDPSADITPSATVLKFNTGKRRGVLGFSCAATVKGTTLDYKLGGTNEDNFKLSSSQITVTAVDAGTQLTVWESTLTKDAASTAPLMLLAAKCPTIGKGYIWFAPSGASPVTSDATSVQAAYDAYVTEVNKPPVEGEKPKRRHGGPQWSFFAVTDATATYAASFSTISL